MFVIDLLIGHVVSILVGGEYLGNIKYHGIGTLFKQLS
jgi:hypothetical protein